MTTKLQENHLETTNGSSPAEMIQLAVNKNADLEKLEKVLALQERWEANQARKAYHQAMASFKANPPVIGKDKTVSFGQGKAAYKHASLYQVTEKISTELSKYGLSASWRVSQNGSISVTTRIAHIDGHFEETTLSAPADTSGSKNSIQAIGSTITYLERYGLLAMTGLATVDEDDDGNAAVTEFIDNKQLNQILDMIADKEVDVTKFLAFLKVESLEKMPKAKFQQAMAALENKKKK